jgi:Amt family ammonium transporter
VDGGGLRDARGRPGPRAKNTTEILTKNVALFAIACIMYMVCGYAIMYGGGFFLSTITGDGVDAGS